jgi:hypothetical protein
MPIRSDKKVLKLPDVLYEVKSPIKNNKISYQDVTPKLSANILYEVPSPFKKQKRILHEALTPQKLFQKLDIISNNDEKLPMNSSLNVINVLHDEAKLSKPMSEGQGMYNNHLSKLHNISHNISFKEKEKINNTQTYAESTINQSSPISFVNKIDSFENMHGEIDSLHSSLYSTELSEIINEIPTKKRNKLSSV